MVQYYKKIRKAIININCNIIIFYLIPAYYNILLIYLKYFSVRKKGTILK